MVRLAYDKKEEYNWRVLKQGTQEYNLKEINGYLVININKMLWQKVRNILGLKKKGFDSPIMIDGKRRTGKSTLAKTIAYLIDPTMTIKNFVAGLEDSIQAIETIKEDSALIFDESSLNFGSKDAMKKAQNQLIKIIDVVGQKKLTLIFVLPSFFELNRTIAIIHTLFLIHVYTDEKLNRGRFAYFGTKAKKKLYEIGKKNFHSYSRPQSNFTGLFKDFQLPFEAEYIKLKQESLRQALNPKTTSNTGKYKLLESQLRTRYIMKFKENCPNIPNEIIAKGFGIAPSDFYRRKKAYDALQAPKENNYINKLIKDEIIVDEAEPEALEKEKIGINTNVVHKDTNVVHKDTKGGINTDEIETEVTPPTN